VTVFPQMDGWMDVYLRQLPKQRNQIQETSLPQDCPYQTWSVRGYLFHPNISTC
jgi:hypothetical protein